MKEDEGIHCRLYGKIGMYWRTYLNDEGIVFDTQCWLHGEYAILI